MLLARSHVRVAVSGFLLLSLAACADPPTKEMDQAQGAIDAARAAGAAEYAPQEYQAALASLKRSNEAVEQRDYRLALNFALDARERAQDAARQAANEKARARSQAETAAQALDLALARARDLAQEARQARLPPRTTRGLGSATTRAEKALQEARARLERQQFREVAPALEGILRELRAAIAAVDAELTTVRVRRPIGRGRR